MIFLSQLFITIQHTVAPIIHSNLHLLSNNSTPIKHHHHFPSNHHQNPICNQSSPSRFQQLLIRLMILSVVVTTQKKPPASWDHFIALHCIASHQWLDGSASNRNSLSLGGGGRGAFSVAGALKVVVTLAVDVVGAFR